MVREQIGERIKNLREKKKFSREALVNKIGISNRLFKVWMLIKKMGR